MSSVRNTRKLYVSNVSRDARERDIGHLFSECGRIARVQFKQNFCFVEFESSHGAQDALRRFNGIDFMGRRLVVEPYVYRGGDPRYRPSVLSGRDRYGNNISNGNGNGGGSGGGGGTGSGGGGTGGGGGGSCGYRLIVTGLDSMTSWQDLKDFGRTAGKSVSFADVYTKRGQKEGIIEYHDYEDYKHALRYLDEARLNGVRVRVDDDKNNNNRNGDNRGGGGGGRRSRSRSRSHNRYRSISRSRSRDRNRDRDRDRDRDRNRSNKYRSRSRSPRSRSRSNQSDNNPQKRDRDRHRSLSNDNNDNNSDNDDNKRDDQKSDNDNDKNK